MTSHSLGLFAGFKIPIPLAERFAMMRDAGFDSTVLWWDDADGERRVWRDSVPDMARDAGLAIDHFHVPYRGCNVLWGSLEADRMALVQRHVQWVRDCARHDIPTMVMHVTQGRAVPEPTPEGIDSLRRIVAAGEDSGVTVAVENTHCPDHLDALLAAIDSPCLGLCYDISHDWLHSGAPFALLRRWRHRVAALHLNDTDGRLDRHWLPGEGQVDFSEVMRILAAGTDSPVLMLEVVPKDRAESVEPFLARARQSGIWLQGLHRAGRAAVA
ncbi:MAG: hypothetical protein AMXMBFR84_03310 [Candidatus Hydrogenedentota bacterium]